MASDKLRKFYRSTAWEKFNRALKLARAEADGTVRCAHCGKPIVKKYDCIAHHVIELTDENVDDAEIALNPDNLILVHFDCHNQIHERFGYGNIQYRRTRGVYIIYGPPCAGKTTFVKENAKENDIVLDIDRLWGAMRAESCQKYEKPEALKQNVFAMRDLMLDMIKTRRGRWKDAYIIGGYPLQGERERLMDIVGADKAILIDTPKDVCLLRAKERPKEYAGYIEEWFGRYSPPPGLRDF